MLYLATIFHMHQPYYKNLLTQEAQVPWVRLHGTKDYLDMVEMLERFPAVHQSFNLVPSLIEQIEDYLNHSVKDKFWEYSLKPAAQLSDQEKVFILNNFFSIFKEKVIAIHPRYYELYFKKESRQELSTQDFLDLQLWFNLAWIDPKFRLEDTGLKAIVNKGRFFTEEEKQKVLYKQLDILKEIIPTYKKFISSGQIEVTTTPFYHPILPLLCSTNIAKEANTRTVLPKTEFKYPEDAKAQIDSAAHFFESRLGVPIEGMWPSEQGVSEHILPFLIEAGVKWIVADEGILFKSLKKKKRDTTLLYQPHLLKRGEGSLNIVFRDRNLSDLIGFVYHSWKAENASDDLLSHLKNIANSFKDEDILVTIAMDGENAWEYFTNDGRDFLELFYKKLSEADFLKTTTVAKYLEAHPAKHQIKRIAAGSWIYSEFGKWIGNPVKVRAWEYLAKARAELEKIKIKDPHTRELAWKQMYICEGSDWFWWYGENHEDFDRLFRMHLSNFYTLIGKSAPEYLNKPIV
ncbi:MAG TPA: glycoside hydrolase family 57 protein [Candidatus Margulisiibacteriota bacterium]|nr:glycoside hydrolase family 57 protein [Candidatus Margulisiibacteriota bacterium]